MATTSEKISYWFDRILRSSFSVQIIFLIFFTFLIIGGGAILAILFTPNREFSEALWYSFLHFIDPGFLDGDQGLWGRIFATSIVLSGWVIFGLLISVISTSMQERLEAIRRGARQIIDRNHTVILGWGNTVFSILDQLYADDEGLKGSVVLLADREKDQMELEIEKYCLNPKAKQTLVRTGSIQSVATLKRVNVHFAREVIILDDKEDDYDEVPDSRTLKTVLAIIQEVSSVKENPISYPLTVVAAISTKRTKKLMPKDLQPSEVRKVRVIMVETLDILARLMAQCAGQPGLSFVFRDLLTYKGDLPGHEIEDSSEIYCIPMEEANIPSGVQFRDCLFSLGEAIPIGYCPKKGSVVLNPLQNGHSPHSLHEGDKIIVIASCKRNIRWQQRSIPKIFRHPDARLLEARQVLLFGNGKKAQIILRELVHYLPSGSVIYTTLDIINDQGNNGIKISHLQNKSIDDILEDPQCLKLHEIDTVILADDTKDRDEHDTRVLALMMAIRTISQELKNRPTVVAELLDPRNRELAQAVDVREIIVSTAKTSNFMVQLARDPNRAEVFQELFDAEGMEFYLKHAPLYSPRDQERVCFDDLASSALERKEIAIGYLPPGQPMSVLSPQNRTEKKTPSDFGFLVVLAENA